MTGERKPPSRVRVLWRGDQEFDAGRPGGPMLHLDGHGRTAQSPPDALLSALAACASVDTVEILAKRKTPVSALRVEVTGERVTTTPRRFEHVLLEFHVDGDGIERPHAERAIDLSISKYCSVRDSLAANIVIEWTLVLNGEPGVLINTAGAPQSRAH